MIGIYYLPPTTRDVASADKNNSSPGPILSAGLFKPTHTNLHKHGLKINTKLSPVPNVQARLVFLRDDQLDEQKAPKICNKRLE
uniref:Uncharacterized protein n=1 Tax=Romanomermis culicivorax TaxID=13658 RepID=A0A915KUQ2_ROMCU